MCPVVISDADPTADPAADAFRCTVQRVKAEFLEMPGLTLTVAQAARLWSLDAGLCTAVLSALEQTGFLVRTRHSAFARAE
jgi:DNA-binding MarR family transcriptional regulator